jgi:hypothetical protein
LGGRIKNHEEVFPNHLFVIRVNCGTTQSQRIKDRDRTQAATEKGEESNFQIGSQSQVSYLT